MGCGRTDDSSRLVNLHSYTDDPFIIETETIKLLKQLNFIVADLRGVRERKIMKIKNKIIILFYLDWYYYNTISINN
jgi:hypothetical protein